MYCKTERSRIRELIGALMLPIFAVIIPRTGAAQEVAAQDTAPLTLLMVIVPDTIAAQDAMTSVSQTSTGKTSADKQSPPPNTAGRPVDVGWVEPYYAIASKDKSGKDSFKMEATAIEKQSLPESLFVPPAGVA